MKYAWVVIDNDVGIDHSIVSICEDYVDALSSAFHYIRTHGEDNSEIDDIDFTNPEEGVNHIVISTKNDGWYHFTMILKEIQTSL